MHFCKIHANFVGQNKVPSYDVSLPTGNLQISQGLPGLVILIYNFEGEVGVRRTNVHCEGLREGVSNIQFLR